MLSEVVTCNCVRNPGGHAGSSPRPAEEGVSFYLVLRPLDSASRGLCPARQRLPVHRYTSQSKSAASGIVTSTCWGSSMLGVWWRAGQAGAAGVTAIVNNCVKMHYVMCTGEPVPRAHTERGLGTVRDFMRVSDVGRSASFVIASETCAKECATHSAADLCVASGALECRPTFTRSARSNVGVCSPR